MSGASVKTSETIGSFSLLTVAALCALGCLLLTLFTSPKITISQDLPLWIWVALPAVLILFIEMTLFSVRGALAIRPAMLQSERVTIWARFGTVEQWFRVASGVIIAVGVAGVWFLILRSSNGVAITAPFVTQAITYASWVLVRPFVIPILRLGGQSAKRLSAATRPTYELTPDAVIIDMHAIRLGSSARRWQLKVPFAEIDEIRSMSWREAELYENTSIGPNASLAMKSASDWMAFAKGAIPRMSVWINVVAVGGATVLIRGADLLYLFTVAQNDVSDLLNAYAEFRRKHPRAGHFPA